MSSAKAIAERQPDGQDEISSKGLAIYERELKSVLEPSLNGQFVSIHIASGEYAAAARARAAIQAIQRRMADGPLVTTRIGSEPECGLVTHQRPRTK